MVLLDAISRAAASGPDRAPRQAAAAPKDVHDAPPFLNPAVLDAEFVDPGDRQALAV
jgi:hypothetical protein